MDLAGILMIHTCRIVHWETEILVFGAAVVVAAVPGGCGVACTSILRNQVGAPPSGL